MTPGSLGFVAVLSSSTTVGDTYDIVLMNDRLTPAVVSGLVLVAGTVLITAAHAADLLRLNRYVAGVRSADPTGRPDVARCSKRGLVYPGDQLVARDGALLCRDDYRALESA